ncbi:uncharacterized protein LOC129587101 [Paramacrobiotus metropolitanus]|uniref:uncharacterized protein LOC129587101 n=1 Tax=Paramacrobiotus metropolitanus TaxID=2943436 RepID=UPI00244627C1|nr:uncharacterized protein LOC129587101 [Paramacrobiotus metropolitanus]
MLIDNWAKRKLHLVILPSLLLWQLAEGFQEDPQPFNFTLNFDLSPMTLRECNARPVNNCGPKSLALSNCRYLQKSSRSRHKRDATGVNAWTSAVDRSTAATGNWVSYLVKMGLLKNASGEIINSHVTLDCWNVEAATKQEFVKQVSAIKKRSPLRAVKATIQNDDFFSPDTIGLIGQQVVILVLRSQSSNITSRIPALDMINLLDLTFKDCMGLLVLKKSDFTPLRNVRIILFRGVSAVASVERDTFTDLPDLQFLDIDDSNIPGYNDTERVSAMTRLYRDPQNDWLWAWLDCHPKMPERYDMGEVYKLGSLFNAPLEKLRLTGYLSKCPMKAPVEEGETITMSSEEESFSFT